MISASKASNLMMSIDLSSFSGEWVALEGAKIIAHGKDLKGVHSQLKGISLSKILFTKVPGSETMIL